MENLKGNSSPCSMLAQLSYPSTPRRPRTRVRSCKMCLTFNDTPLTSTHKRKRCVHNADATKDARISNKMNFEDERLGSAELKSNFHGGQTKNCSELTADDRCERYKKVPRFDNARQKEQEEQKVVHLKSPMSQQDVGSVSEQTGSNARNDNMISLENQGKGKLVQEGKGQTRFDVMEPQTPIPARQKCPSSRKGLIVNKKTRVRTELATSQKGDEFLSLEELAYNAHYYTRSLNKLVLNQIESLKNEGASNQTCNRTGHRQISSGQLKMHGTQVTLKGKGKQSKKLQRSPEAGKEEMRAWKKLMKNSTAQSHSPKSDQDEGISWEDESQSFCMRGLKFIVQVESIQGTRKYLPWKGSVLDSVIGAFLTQRVSDTFSSSAFMSLGASFPQHHACSVYSKHHRMLREKRSNAIHSHKKPASGLENELEKPSRKPFDDKEKETPKKGKVPMKGIPSPDWNSLRTHIHGDVKRERSIDAVDYVDWVSVRRADAEHISKAISSRGMNKKLAQRIKDFLERLVLDHGNLDLEWVRNLPPQKAKEFLLSIKGVGLKSGECVRLLTLRQPAFPVDVNVARVTVRLGWVPAPPIDDNLKMHLLEQNSQLHKLIHQYLFPRLCKLDQEKLYELHYQMITFGKVFCRKQKPSCGDCPMRNECNYNASTYKRKRPAKPHNTKGSVAVHAFGKQRASLVDKTTPSLRARCQSKTCKRNNSEIDIEDFCPTFCVVAPKTPEKIQPPLRSRPKNMKNKSIASTRGRQPNRNQTRTEHLVYELPDWHPILETFDDRDPDDSSPYLLVTWESSEGQCGFQKSGEPFIKNALSCSFSHVKQSQTVPGTILIPCRTALRGKFPLNGTYFQTNEVFADHMTTQTPITVRCKTLQQIPWKILYCGNDLSRIVKGLSAHEIQNLFKDGRKSKAEALVDCVHHSGEVMFVCIIVEDPQINQVAATSATSLLKSWNMYVEENKPQCDLGHEGNPEEEKNLYLLGHQQVFVQLPKLLTNFCLVCTSNNSLYLK